MTKAGQGFLLQSRLKSLYGSLLLPVIFIANCNHVCADNQTAGKHISNADIKHQIHIIYEPDNALVSTITQNISESFLDKRTDIIITTSTTEDRIPESIEPDLVIAAGTTSIEYARTSFPETGVMHITTTPDKFKLDKKNTDKNSVLYMTQPYCRQLTFIKAINPDWNSISILTRENKSYTREAILACKNTKGITVYETKTTDRNKLTDNVKDALTHSDLLLALPNKDIYNSNTVKNILLTSYRYRKPVIAFSKSFTRSGALASIYSNSKQLSSSAVSLIEYYIDHGYRFEHTINYPADYDISFNSQVFKALDITIPDIKEIKHAIDNSTKTNEKDR